MTRLWRAAVKMNVRKSTIERVIITGLYTEMSKGIDYCTKRGYVVVSGPRMVYKDRYTPTRYKFVAERKVEK
jgi:hypothetical protein